MPETTFLGKWDGSLLARYLPTWMLIQSPLSKGATYGAKPYGSFAYGPRLAENTLLYKWFGNSPARIDTLQRYILSFKGYNTVSDNALDAPRLAWIYETVKDPTSVTVSGTTVRRAATLFDFMTAADPVFQYKDNLCIMRNLALTTVVLSSSTDVYTLPSDMVADAAAWVQIGTDLTWYQLSPGQELDTVNATASIPLTGTVSLKYISTTQVTAVTSGNILSIENNPINPIQIDLWNVFDEKALLAGIVRINGETNLALRNRIRSAYATPPGPKLNELLAAIGRDMGLVSTISWNTSSSIDFGPLGILNVNNVYIENLPEREVVNGELLTPSDDYTTYHSQHAEWESGWFLYVDGLKTTTTTPPYPTITDNHITFGTPISGSVTAHYIYKNYTLATTGSSASLYPTPNTPDNTYTVTYVTDVQLHAIADKTYQIANLLSSEGKPNAEFTELANIISSAVPITLGTVDWGQAAYWFTKEEPQPELTNLPITFD